MAQDTPERGTWKRWGAGIALAASGLLAGGVIASAIPASAESTAAATTAATTDTATTDSTRTVDESKSQRSDESLLTGDTANKVKAAALAKYPGATIQRIETDSDGVYEAHLTTAAGDRVTVELGKDFAVTGTETGGGHGGGHDGGRGA
jgi:hypothetical protein